MRCHGSHVGRVLGTLGLLALGLLARVGAARADSSVASQASRGEKLDLHRGVVWLPPGWSYAVEKGVDSYVGRILDQKQRTRLRWDVGDMAGRYVEPGREGFGQVRSERVGETTLWYGLRGGQLVMTLEPGVNLYGAASTAAERDLLLAIARSFRPGR
jgi:hypothetical protein